MEAKTMSLIFNMLRSRVEAHTDELFLVEDNTRWTYGEFLDRVKRLASTLAAQGIQPGDRVALMFMNQKEYLLGFFAVLHLGGVVVPINLQLGADDIMFVLRNSGSRLVLTTAGLAAPLVGKIPLLVANQETPEQPSFEEALEKGNPEFTPSSAREADNLAVLMYTSGTTGQPKGVMLSEKNLMSNIEGIHPVLKLAQDNRALLALPLFHAFGLMIGLYIISIGARLILVPKFTPRKIIQAMMEEKVTMLPLVPTMFGLILDGVQKVGLEPFKSLKYCISGGASLPAELLKRIENALDVVVLEGYGLTETSPVLAVNSPDVGSIPRSVGRPLPNVEIRLLDDHGNVIPWKPGETSGEGEIVARGPNVMLGYYELPEETGKVMDAEGWFRTGDLGHFDPDGNLFISGGRKKDLIIKAGENITPLKIEEVLYQHPAIQDASVIGVKDEKVGEEILACIQFRPGQSATAGELKKFCRQYLPAFMVPECFRVYEELPKNQTGKILKKVLREENPTLPQVSSSATE
jgi:long-chain acyl-CoA synthetase